MKIIFFVEGKKSLGHINRGIELAKSILKYENNNEIKFILDSDFTQPFEDNGFEFIKVNPCDKNIGTYGGTLPIEYNKPIKEILLKEKPDIIIFDTFFTKAILNDMELRKIRKILLLRKYKNNEMKIFLDKVFYKLFDLILIPHLREEFSNFEDKYSKQLDSFKFMGPIIKDINRQIKKEHANREFKILAICGGGGFNDVDKFIKSNLDVYSSLKNKIKNLDYCIITGPFYKNYKQLKKKEEETLKIKDYEKEIMSLMQNVDLIISQAGYNTINEIMVTKIPAIIMPGFRNNDDQMERAFMLQRQGVANVVKDYNTYKLFHTILDYYKDKTKLKNLKRNFDKIKFESGNEKAAEEIINLSKTKTYRIKLGKTCNNNCVYCDILNIKSERDKTIKTIKKEMEGLKKKGYNEIILPCNADIRKDFFEILKCAKDLKFKLTLETNGRMLYYKGFVKKIVEYVGKFDVFINGAGNTHNRVCNTNSFDQTIRGINNLLELGTDIQINTVITNYNYRNLNEIVSLVKKLGIKDIRPVFPVLKEKKEHIPEVVDCYQYIGDAIRLANDNGLDVVTGELFCNPFIPEDLNLDYGTAKLFYEKNDSMTKKEISIIVPTYNRKDLLKLTLMSLFYQNYPQDKYEIIVVDDGSDDGTFEMVKKLKPTCNFKYIYWPRNRPYKFGEPGNRAGPARNLGVIYAKGNVLLFWDSDMVANPNLIENYLRKSMNNNIAITGIRKPLKDGAFEKNEIISLISKKKFKLDKSWLGPLKGIDKQLAECNYNIMGFNWPWKLFMSNNFIITKETFNAIGGFDHNFVYWGDEDQEFTYRLLSHDVKLMVNKKAIAYHQFHPSESLNSDVFFRTKKIHKNILYKKHLDKNIYGCYKGKFFNSNKKLCNKKRILFFATNGVGLGHLNRTSVIANEILKVYPKTDILFLTRAKDNSLLNRYDLKHVKLKSSKDNENRDERGLIRKTVSEFKPDAIVIDTILTTPSFPSVFIKDEKINQVKKVLILRKQDNFILKSFLSEHVNKFIKILVPHTKDEFFSLINDNFLSSKFQKFKNTVFTGPISREINQNRIKDVKMDYNIKDDDWVIVVTGGGGGHNKWTESPKRIYESMLDIHDKLVTKIKNLKVIFILGPHFNKKIKKNDRIIIKKFEQNMLELLSLSDLVISSVGYNISNELLYLKKPAILIPLKRFSNDQIERASFLKKEYGYQIIPQCDKEKLFETILSFYRGKLKIKPISDSFSGAIEAAQQIIDEVPTNHTHIPKINLLEWKISNKCNYSCSYCQSSTKSASPVNVKNYKRVIDMFKRLHGKWCISVGTSCEPLIVKNLSSIFKMIVSDTPHNVSFHTNFSSDTGTIIKLIKILGERLDFVCASLHLEFTEPYDFLEKAKIIDSYLKTLNKGLTVTAVAVPERFEKLVKLGKLFRKSGINFILQPLRLGNKYYKYNSDERKLIEQFGRKHGLDSVNFSGRLCYAGVKYFMLDDKGNAFRCRSAKSSDKDGYLGNVFEGSFKLWPHPRTCTYDVCRCVNPVQKKMVESEKIKILFNSINGVGLGHLNRCIILADTIKKLNPLTEIFFITNSLFKQPLENRGYSFVKLMANLNSSTANKNFTIGSKPYFDISYFLKFKDTINKEKPNTIIYDSYFDQRILTYSFKRNIKNVLILRKKDAKNMLEFFKGNFINLFDRILIPHKKEEILETKYGHLILNEISKHSHVSFVGYLCKKLEYKNRDLIKNKYQINDNDFLITVSCGGGGFDKNNQSPHKLLEYISQSYKILNQEIKNLRIIVVKGPYSDFDDSSIELINYEPHILELISLSNLYISTAGYNACNDIMIAKTPSILIPFMRHQESQLENAKSLEKKGIVKILTKFEGKKLIHMILDLYNNPKKLQKMKKNCNNIKLDIGNERAAKEILKLVKNPRTGTCGFGDDTPKSILHTREDFLRKRIKTVVWELTNACNYNCSYCTQGNRRVSKIKINNYKAIIDGFKKLKGTWDIRICGGEPLIIENISTIINEILKETKHKISIVTNLSPKLDRILKILDIPKNRLGQEILASLHLESCDLKDFFIKAKKINEFLKKKDKELIIGCVAEKENLIKLQKIGRMFRNHQLNVVLQPKKVGDMRFTKYSTKEKEIIKEFGRTFGLNSVNFYNQICCTGIDYFVLDHHGDAYRCHSAKYFSGKRSDTTLNGYLGNFYKKTFKPWNKPRKCIYHSCDCITPFRTSMIGCK